MPLRRFWLLSEMIDRLKSADDIRAIRVAASVLSSDAYSKTINLLQDAVGEIVIKTEDAKVYEKRDQRSIQELKAAMMNL
ncbi:MAG: hypothetical protein ACXWXL_03340 [Candidatus Binatia bacterium]